MHIKVTFSNILNEWHATTEMYNLNKYEKHDKVGAWLLMLVKERWTSQFAVQV